VRVMLINPKFHLPIDTRTTPHLDWLTWPPSPSGAATKCFSSTPTWKRSPSPTWCAVFGLTSWASRQHPQVEAGLAYCGNPSKA